MVRGTGVGRGLYRIVLKTALRCPWSRINLNRSEHCLKRIKYSKAGKFGTKPKFIVTTSSPRQREVIRHCGIEYTVSNPFRTHLPPVYLRFFAFLMRRPEAYLEIYSSSWAPRRFFRMVGDVFTQRGIEFVFKKPFLFQPQILSLFFEVKNLKVIIFEI